MSGSREFVRLDGAAMTLVFAVSACGSDPLTRGVTGAAIGADGIDSLSSIENLIGTDFDDTLTGNGGVDRFNAGKGNDTVVLQTSDVANLSNNTIGGIKAMVDGGTGFDTLQVSAAGVNLDMTAISNVSAMVNEGASRINSIERINLGSDATANTLTLTAKDVNDMADFNSIRLGASDDGKTWSNVTGTALSATTKFHQVVVEGTAADALTLEVGAGAWANVGEVNYAGGPGYFVYQNTETNSQVIVDKTVPPVQPHSMGDRALHILCTAASPWPMWMLRHLQAAKVLRSLDPSTIISATQFQALAMSTVMA